MSRIATLLAFAAALVIAAPASAQTLRPVATVSASVVTIGDLFANAGSHAAEPVVAAPPAGTQITYDSDWLAAVASEHNLAWRPNSTFGEVTIERASDIVDANQVSDSLMKAVEAQAPAQNATIELDNPGLRLVVPAGPGGDIAVTDLTLDRSSGRITAMVVAPANDPAATRQRVTARLVYHVSVPVLTRAIQPGSLIAAGDIQSIDMRRDRIGNDIATDPQLLVGKTPRRPLVEGEPVRLSDVQLPILVHKDELVTVLLETPNLQLQVQAKALEDGANNAMVRVMNTKSSRVIDTVVVGDATVAVVIPGNAAQTTAMR